jgi:hypothetical protein
MKFFFVNERNQHQDGGEGSGSKLTDELKFISFVTSIHTHYLSLLYYNIYIYIYIYIFVSYNKQPMLVSALVSSSFQSYHTPTTLQYNTCILIYIINLNSWKSSFIKNYESTLYCKYYLLNSKYYTLFYKKNCCIIIYVCINNSIYSSYN